MNELKFSANLGFLWKELSLPAAIRAAKANGFDAVECHWPYDTEANLVLDALEETSLSMRSINTIAGNNHLGEFGVCALPGRSDDAHDAIDQALQYASLIHCPFVHIMAGKSQGPAAHRAFIDNLAYATSKAEALGIAVLIEPLNEADVPGYFLNSAMQAADIISTLGANNLKLLFDCYHVELIHGNVIQHFHELETIIGHIQIASVPSRLSPDLGALDYTTIFSKIASSSYAGFIGAEYKPVVATEDTLGWMHQ
ncbi:MAG: hydroxypyruvate isomerase [Saprospiraceae bacterium]|jgi:hydroxypyruvate isomerase